MRSRIILFGAAAIIIVALIVLTLADGLVVDFLWFDALGFRQVFSTTLLAEVAIFAIVWLIAFVAMAISGLAALGLSHDRERLHVVRRPDQITEVNLPELIRSMGDRIPWKLIVLALAGVLALFAAQGEAASWDVYLKAIYGVPFGLKEPSFNKDIGFFVFQLPFWQEMRDLFLLILVLTSALTAAVYWARGEIDFRDSPPQISRSCAAHLSVLLGIFFLQRGVSYWIARFELTLHTNGVVYGLRYVDHILWKPGLWVLVALSIAAAAICFSNFRERGLRLPVAAVVVVFGPSIIMSLLQPAIERLWVKPDELRIEEPYLKRNIELTRHAYNIDDVDVKPFLGNGRLTPASFDEDSTTIKNIRLWDPRPLIATYQQLQEIRLYYTFQDVDIDRYWLNHDENEVMLAARELNVDLLPQNAQTWVNRHLKFTHGYGVVMSPVNTKDQEGLPVLYIKNIPPKSNVGINIDQPGIYFGTLPDNYVVVKAQTPEFDYPRGNDNVFDFYKANGGVAISGLLRRLLFSYYYRDINLLVTQNIVSGSHIMFRRNISERVATLAPFLNQDHDPYLVVHDGGLYWMMDTYTVSDHYPYSQRNMLGINYIRNSVKVVVNAYTGQTDFYVSDPDDPIIRTWERIYPGMFKAMSDMPADLRLHIRYPEDLFLIQAEIYCTYHMTDPAVFYNREDLWSFPKENYSDETTLMQPYYVIMRLPGERNAEYILMLPMVPQGRDNMIAWMAARCDGADYGHLFEFQFSKDKLFYGPYQIQARINQNPEISQQYSLWNQMGSKVILGNLLVIPVEDSLLYVEPLYIRAQNGQLPELKRVLASYSDRTVMGDTLNLTLAALLKGNEGAAPPTIANTGTAPKPETQLAAAQAAETSTNSSAGKPIPGLTSASDHYGRALQALRDGDWTQFGAEMQKLGAALGQTGEHH
ncbi:MAG TPA: UPF0182 family protein [Candidatus Binataceae bacterium]|nr:UPF0182 family protein [Candidatus Binataceae bacterium]